MKKMILAIALTLSSSAFAEMCRVDIVNNRTRTVIERVRAYDRDSDCSEGMKACRLRIRELGLYGRADCEKVFDRNPYPNPQPQPQPNPYPYPYPQPNPYPENNYEVRRPVRSGEVVYHNNREATVIGIGYNNSYAIRTTDIWNNAITLTGIPRESLSITTGCNSTLCVNDSVISLSNVKDARIVGLTHDDRFVISTVDIWNNRIIMSSIDRSQLAITTPGACSYSGRTAICVGDRVLGSSNREGTVIGLQTNNNVVLRTTDIWNNSVIQAHVDPSTLYITRR